MDETESFIARWSRRKLEAERGVREAAPADAPDAPPASASGAERAARQGPEAHSGRDEYFDPRIEEKLRRAALRKLFSEPQFNVMDGLDTYIDDYTKADPIPPEMLRELEQAKDLLRFEQEAGMPEEDEERKAGAALPPEQGRARVGHGAAAPGEGSPAPDAPEGTSQSAG